MTDNILISIIIPTHNRPTLLPRAVSSALDGCESFAELVVIEDGSANAARALIDFSNDHRLKLINNQGPRGASAARNCGVEAARGELLLFLDDDDELISDYPARVLEIASYGQAEWGFAQQLLRNSAMATETPPAIRKRTWPGGTADSKVPFRRKMAAMSSGFWIKKALFTAIGGLNPKQIIDEDTDLCCRLIASGYEPWFERRPAVILDRMGETARLTNQTTAGARAENYLSTFTRNNHACRQIKGAESFLAFRAQRMIMRSGRVDMLPVLLNDIRNPLLRTGLFIKRILFALCAR